MRIGQRVGKAATGAIKLPHEKGLGRVLGERKKVENQDGEQMRKAGLLVKLVETEGCCASWRKIIACYRFCHWGQVRGMWKQGLPIWASG